MAQTISAIVWVDLEMTGLDPYKDKILEMACLITDPNLNLLDENGFEAIVHMDESDLSLMDDFVRRMHINNGLVEKSLKSRLSLRGAEQKLYRYIKKFVAKGEAPLAGNSIWKDRSFMYSQMPKVHGYLHHRVIDASSFKQLYLINDAEKLYVKEENKDSHRALFDIRYSIDELKYYRDLIFKKS